MPEVMATITDPHRLKYYILKMAGPPAARVFTFCSSTEYHPTDFIHLGNLPVIMGRSGTGSSDQANAGVYITSNITIQDVLCPNGDLSCSKTGQTFVRQAVLEPHDNNIMIVTTYLRNGELLMHPAYQDQPPSEKYVYPFSPILIGQGDHLGTELGLSALKDKLNVMVKQKAVELSAKVSSDISQPGPSGTSGSGIRCEPASSSEDSANASSLDSSTSASVTLPSASSVTASSSILAGTLGSVPSTVAGEDNSRSNLGSVPIPGLDPNFEPWMTSTEVTPASSRPPSSQSLPTPDGSPTKEQSPRRPRSTTPVGARRRHKKTADRLYRPETRTQTSMDRFVTPSPPKGSPPNNSPTAGHKRRSARLNIDDQPDPKRANTTSPSDANGGNITSNTPESMELTGQGASNGQSHSSVSVEEIILDPITLEEPAPNSSVEIIGERRTHVQPLAYIDLVDDSPNTSRESSRRTIISIASSRGDETNQPPAGASPDPNAIIDLPLTKANVTLHTNLPMDRIPQHVFIKAEQGHLFVKFLTFKATNLEEVVRAFFSGIDDFDNPEELQGVADFAFEQFLTPEDSQDSAQTVVLSTSSNAFENARVTIVSRDVQNASRTTITVSDPEDNVLPDDDSNPQTMSQSIRDMEVIRDIGFQRETDLIIEDIRTAGVTTLENANDDTNDAQEGREADTSNGNGQGDERNEGETQRDGGEGAQGNGGD